MPYFTNVLTAAQSRAARAMLDWSVDVLADAADVDAQSIRDFEMRFRKPDDESLRRMRTALENAGLAFIPDRGRGAGVQFKFNTREVRAIKHWEAEGGRTGHDAVY
jgi:hypothetical protein